ncbi:MAG: fluoride efflux transporter CrcB [Pseudomonadota bacterium]
MVANLIMVAIGGALGAMARYGLGIAVLRATGPGFPLGVMAANVIGSFLMGVFVVVAAQRGLTHLSPFVMVGLFGGFTTFSAFSLETVTLFERGEWLQAGLYVILSVALSVGALVLGLVAARALS